MPRKIRTPSLRRHKPSGLGVVTLDGKDHYLGRWPENDNDPPAEVRAEYDRVLAEWLVSRRGLVPPTGRAGGVVDGPTVEDLLAAFWAHAEQHYRHADGSQTRELLGFRHALRPLRHLYAQLPVAEFTPLKLKAVRQLMLDGYEHPAHGPQQALARRVINHRVGRIVRAFKWGVGEELVPPEVLHGLRAVAGLQKGRTKAREPDPILPVAQEVVLATLPYLPPHVAGMVRLQLHTGMRPGEVSRVRLGDIDRSGPVWLYRPARHKTAWRGKERVVAIGPRGQEAISEFVRVRCPVCAVEGRPSRIGCRDGALCGPCADRADERGMCGPWRRVEAHDPDAYLFSPAVARLERFEDKRARRKTRVQPSQASRKKRRPKKAPGPFYLTSSYSHAVTKGCRQAKVVPWHPNQLRHTHGTVVRQRYGLEAAQVALGHSEANVTQVYAERDLTLALRVAAEMG